MEWIENLKEPITRYDVLGGLLGYVMIRSGMLAFSVIKKIYKNAKKSS